eukprot:9495591-Pyramimonas_sp.AAC.1
MGGGIRHGGGCIDPQAPMDRGGGPDGPSLPRKVRSHHRGPVADLSAMHRRFQVDAPPLCQSPPD